jgi:hypothetical protein
MIQADAHNITVANRRNFMIVAGGLAAAIAGGLAFAAASPTACQAPDPTLAAHVFALRAFDIAAKDCEHNVDGLRSPEEQTAISNPAYRACRVSIAASMDVANLVPTTEAGHRALADHLRVDRYREEVEGAYRINAYTARTGEKFVVDLV